MSRPRLLIVWHSRTGGSAAMANAAAQGAAEDAEVTQLPAHEATPETMLAHNAYLFAAPENLAGLSGAMKEFLDRCYYPLLGAIEGRAYAAMICAGSDGEGAARQLARIALGWRLRPIAEPLIVNTAAQTMDAILAPKTLSPADLERCRTLGATLAAGLAIGMF